jgi:hypothetical protein
MPLVGGVAVLVGTLASPVLSFRTRGSSTVIQQIAW